MKKPVSLFLIACCILPGAMLKAQFAQVWQDPDAGFKNAKELYQREQYSLAYPVFKNLYANGTANSKITCIG